MAARRHRATDTSGVQTGYLPHDLSRLINTLNLKLMKQLRPTELTVQQFRVMQYLRSVEVASIGEICTDTVIEQSVVSRIVDQLQLRGFATRRKRPTNARVVEVSLTAVGVAVYDSVFPAAKAIADDTVAVLSEDEHRLLTALLGRLLAKAKENP